MISVTLDRNLIHLSKNGNAKEQHYSQMAIIATCWRTAELLTK